MSTPPPATPPAPPPTSPTPPAPPGMTMPPPGMAAPTPARAPKKWVIPVVAVVVVVVVVIVAAFALGLFNPASHGTGSGGATPDYAAAQSAATSTANSQSGGPWKAFAAFGLAPTFAFSLPVNTSSFPSSSQCSGAHLDVANGSMISVDSFSGNLSSGKASGWGFVFLGATGTELLVFDNGGNTFPIGSVNCPSLGQVYNFIGSLSSSASSESAAATAWGHGGSAFASAHSGTSEMFTLIAGISLFGSTVQSPWSVTFDQCTESDVTSGTLAPSTSISVNASSNAFVSQTNGTSSCAITGTSTSTTGPPPTRSLAQDLGFGTPMLISAHGMYNESVAVQSVSGGLTWGNISDVTVNATGFSNFRSTGYVNVTSITGAVVASWNLGSTGWQLGSSTPIQAGDEVTVTFGSTNPVGQGYALGLTSSQPAGDVWVKFA